MALKLTPELALSLSERTYLPGAFGHASRQLGAIFVNITRLQMLVHSQNEDNQSQKEKAENRQQKLITVPDFAL